MGVKPLLVFEIIDYFDNIKFERDQIKEIIFHLTLSWLTALYTSIIYFITYLIDNFKSWEKSCENLETKQNVKC